MKIIITEFSSGFSHYTSVLCDYLSKITEEKIIYLSDMSNKYVLDNTRVECDYIYETYNKKYKKNSIFWLLNRILVTRKNFRIRQKYLKMHKPDVLLIQATLSKFEAKYLKKIKNRTKIVLTVHDVIVPSKSKSWDMKSLKKMYEIADRLIVHSETNKNQLINIFKIKEEKIFVVPHGIMSKYNIIKKEKCLSELNIKNSNPNLLFYGSIRESKGLDVLLDACKGLKVNLIIAGAMPFGETFDNYHKIIEKNQINAIEIIKFTSDEFKDVLFQACDFVVLPYKEFYSQSGVFMQSIRYKKPLIVTNVSSFKEYISKYEIGYVCEPNDYIDLRNIIMKAIEEKKDFSNNLQAAIDDNCWEKIAILYKDVLTLC